MVHGEWLVSLKVRGHVGVGDIVRRKYVKFILINYTEKNYIYKYIYFICLTLYPLILF